MGRLETDPVGIKIGDEAYQFTEPRKRTTTMLWGKAKKIMSQNIDPELIQEAARLQEQHPEAKQDEVYAMLDTRSAALLEANGYVLFPTVLDFVYEALALDRKQIKHIEGVFEELEGEPLLAFMRDVNLAFAAIVGALQRPFVGTPPATQETKEETTETVETAETDLNSGEPTPPLQSDSESDGTKPTTE